MRSLVGYPALALICLTVALFSRGNEVAIMLSTVIYFLATIALTFVFFDKRNIHEDNQITTPVSYYKRLAGLNSRNIGHSLVLVMSAIAFTSGSSMWTYWLFFFWLLHILILALPNQYPGWTIIHEAIYQELKSKLDKDQVLIAVNELMSLNLSAYTPENLTTNLDSDDKIRLIKIYQKMITELNQP